MRETANQWLLLGVGVLVIATLVFGTMYATITSKSNQIRTTISGTNLHVNP
jgi:hypothetical protein